jgi:hypothetical protein
VSGAAKQLELFTLRSFDFADRVEAGEVKFLDAVDVLYHGAVASGLVDAVGDDVCAGRSCCCLRHCGAPAMTIPPELKRIIDQAGEKHRAHVRSLPGGSLLDDDAPNRTFDASVDTQPATGSLIKSSKEFVAGFVPPDYLVDGLLQEAFLYSLTGATGAGKTAITQRLAASVALGAPFANRETKKRRVLYLAARESRRRSDALDRPGATDELRC